LPTDLPPTVSSSPPPAAAAANPPAAAPALQAASDWTTYHRDNTRTGYVPGMPDPQQLTVAWRTELDGAVYAQPLVVGGHVIAATEGNSIYSLNAQTGQVEWRTNMGDPVPRSALPCGNIDPLGITGTPVYDPATGLVFAIAQVTGPAHLFVGVDVRTGQVRVRQSADVEGMEPAPHQQRAALLLSQGVVYVAYGGLFGDCGNYKGRVIAFRTDGSGPVAAFQVPTPREGGIWAPPGPSIGANGRLYVSVGNGAAMGGNWDHSDSVLRLSPMLQLEDGFAPETWPEDNRRDADLGSLGPVLLPDGLIFIAGKSGTGYLLRADALGGVGGQALAQPVCHAYGGAAVVGSTIFIPCTEGLQQVQVGPGATLKMGWRANQAPGSPVVGGHTVYNLDRSGNLYAFNAETGQIRATVEVGATSRFATPTLYQDRIFVGTMNSIVAVTAR
jgi:outer membrane protein assembly factor BamB